LIYFAIVAIYFIVILVIGLLSKNKASTAVGFFVAGRTRSTFFITGSLVASMIGGSATVGMAGLGFSLGFTGIWWLLVGSIGLLVLGLFLAEKVRGSAFYTLPQLAEKQYNGTVSIVISILIIIAWFGVIAGQILATGKILGILDIGSPEQWMIIFTIVFLSYTVVGGQYADIGTDMIKAIIKFIGIFGALAVLMVNVGGWDGLISKLPPGHTSFPLSSQFNIWDLLTYLLLVGLAYVVGPDIYGRLFSSKDAKVARKSAFWSAGLVVVFAVCITLVGMGASILFPNISPEQAFPTMIKEMFHPLLGALIIAALVSATMSAADSCVLSASTIFTFDIVKKLKPDISEKQTMIIARISIVVIGLISLMVALLVKGVINSLLFAYTIYTAGVIIPVLFGFYKDKLKVTPVGALAAIIGGGLVGLISKLFGIKYLDLGALGVSTVLLFSVSYLTTWIKTRSKKNSSQV
jgi:solute:Na+ symporter, SSS family